MPNYFTSGGKVPSLTGNSHPNIAPYDLFDTKTCQIFIAGGNDKAWRKLCDEVGRPELGKDPRFLTNSDRQNNKAELKAELKDVFAEVDGEDFCEKLLSAGLPVGPIRNTQDVMNNAHTIHREMRVEKDWYRSWGIPIKFSRTPGSIKSAPPKFGEHGKEVLEAHGFSKDEIDSLLRDEVLLEKRKKG